MVSVKDTNLYTEVIKEFNYTFGNIFVFQGYIISEINEGIVLNWEDHAKFFVKDVTDFLGTNGEDLILISNRINSYSIIASDWLKFFENNYDLKGYLIVLGQKTAKLGVMVENLFFNNKIKRFNSLYAAVNYVKNGLIEIT
ncbi:hypothetical protein Q4Q35_12000 [Flavivirga aquimarina]|uniref:STAS/SEC14 domain-containing protein n=1 Tax=Flavivirga aquimarina TaxID=2027862 RepID=A0ABT8WBM9_9FLAO|nr:hypothetical protein [Flavivirga aquimarina]MDO5970530.1 hypothetical protein [Flavivirga aquimarina]